MTKLQKTNLVLRGLMETGIILAFGYWGYCLGAHMGTKILLCIAMPSLVFAFWSLVDFHQLGMVSERLRPVQELLVSGLAAIAIYSTGFHVFGWMLGGISIVHHALVYIIGDKLLK